MCNGSSSCVVLASCAKRCLKKQDFEGESCGASLSGWVGRVGSPRKRCLGLGGDDTDKILHNSIDMHHLVPQV